LRSKWNIIAMIVCPRTTFQPSTDIKTNILIFKKNTLENIIDVPFKISIAVNCGHDRRGRMKMDNGDIFPDDFIILADDFHKKPNNVWKTALVKDKYYLVPRYCQDFSNEKVQLNGSITEFENIYSFEELLKSKFIIVRKGNEVGSEAYGTGDIPFIRTSDISNLEITNDPTKSINEEYFNKYQKIQDIRENDILMVADGRYRIGKTAIVLGEKTKCIVQSHIKIIRVTERANFTAFELLYILNQQYVLNQIRSLIFIQSTLGSLGNRINELLIPIPKKSNKWDEKISDFERTLLERNKLLAKLREFQIEEVI
jgi:type I restriction enzyme M protein